MASKSVARLCSKGFVYLSLMLFALLGGQKTAWGVAQITGFQDFPLGTWSGSGDLSAIDGTLCVYESSANPRYFITATGSGSGGAFTLSTGGTTIAYAVGWSNVANATSGFTALTSGTRVRFNGGNKTSPTCGGSYNASLQISVLASSMSGKPSGTYSGTVTILLEPA